MASSAQPALQQPTPVRTRPVLCYASALLLVTIAAGAGYAEYGATIEFLASLTRHTARIAFLFFFVTFTTSVWLTWRNVPATRWLMRHRRHLGLSFALVHFIHLGALSALFAARDTLPDTITLVFGGFAYVLLALLVITSNRAAQRRLGSRWRTLHLTGCWYLWGIFTQSYLGRINPADPADPYPLFLGLSVLAVSIPLLRLWAWQRRRARNRPQPATAAISP